MFKWFCVYIVRHYSLFSCLQDSSQVIESYKSGFEPPGDVEFEDYGLPMKRTASETSLTNSRPDNKADRSSKGKSKTLWPFIKKNKVTHPHTNTQIKSITQKQSEADDQKECLMCCFIFSSYCLFSFVFLQLVCFYSCGQQLLLFVCHHRFPPLSLPFGSPARKQPFILYTRLITY